MVGSISHLLIWNEEKAGQEITESRDREGIVTTGLLSHAGSWIKRRNQTYLGSTGKGTVPSGVAGLAEVPQHILAPELLEDLGLDFADVARMRCVFSELRSSPSSAPARTLGNVSTPHTDREEV